MPIGPLAVVRAAREAREFLESARREGGIYEFAEWPSTRTRRAVPRRGTGAMVAWLRAAQRRTVGFLDPVEDAMFLTAGLRRLGVPATFHLGRETVPAAPPAGFFAWVQCGTEVLSTSLPVHEEYVEVHRSKE